MKTNLISIFVILNLILAGCASQQESVTPTPTLPPTKTPPPLPTSTPTISPTPQPTAIGGSNGSVLIDDYDGNFFVVDLSTGERKVLISQSQLEPLLPPNRSGDSYDYAGDYVAPPQISLSPDLTKAYVSICANLDNRFRCIFEDFIYDIETQSLTKIDKPVGEYGVYWQWSPQGSKLAGAGWRWQLGQYGQEYALTSFYVIDNDGENLKSLTPVTNWHYTLAWSPDEQIVYPLTFASNFKRVYVDGSKVEDVLPEDLRPDDYIECLDFSNDNEKVAFAVTRETQKGYYWVYIANSDFTNASLISEFDTDSHYGCGITLSPDNKFILLDYIGRYTGNGGSEGSSLNILLNVETLSEVDIPQAEICGLSPDGNLAIVEGVLQVINLSTSKQLKLGGNKCPIRWLEEDLSFEIPENLSISKSNFCRPGDAITDEEDKSISPYFDILEVSSSLEGKNLSVTFTLRLLSEDISVYSDPAERSLNGWIVGIDGDNNTFTGDYEGVEYELAARIFPDSIPNIEADLWKYNASDNSSSTVGSAQYSFDISTNTITITGFVPQITQDSRLIFSSYRGFNGEREWDEVCE